MPGRPTGFQNELEFGRLEATLLLLALALSLFATTADYVAIERALGLYKTQANSDRYQEKLEARQRLNPPTSWLARQNQWLTRALDHSAAVLVVATIGAGVAMFGRPRTWRRRSIRGTGVTAIAALAPWLAVSVLNEFLIRRFPKAGWGYEGTFHIWSEAAQPIGGAVVALWLLLWIGRSWRADPSWRDRLGRSLVVAWLGYALVEEFFLPWTYN